MSDAAAPEDGTKGDAFQHAVVSDRPEDLQCENERLKSTIKKLKQKVIATSKLVELYKKTQTELEESTKREEALRIRLTELEKVAHQETSASSSTSSVSVSSMPNDGPSREMQFLQLQLHEALKATQPLKDMIADLTSQISEKSNLITLKDTVIRSKEVLINQLKAEVDKSKADKADSIAADKLSKEHEKLKKEFEQKQKHIERLSDQLEVANKKARQIEQEPAVSNQDLLKKLADYEMRDGASRSTIDGLKQSLIKQQEAVKQSKKEYTSLQRDRTSLQRKLDKAKEKAATLSNTIKELKKQQSTVSKKRKMDDVAANPTEGDGDEVQQRRPLRPELNDAPQGEELLDIHMDPMKEVEEGDDPLSITNHETLVSVPDERQAPATWRPSLEFPLQDFVERLRECLDSWQQQRPGAAENLHVILAQLLDVIRWDSISPDSLIDSIVGIVENRTCNSMEACRRAIPDNAMPYSALQDICELQNYEVRPPEGAQTVNPVVQDMDAVTTKLAESGLPDEVIVSSLLWNIIRHQKTSIGSVQDYCYFRIAGNIFDPAATLPSNVRKVIILTRIYARLCKYECNIDRLRVFCLDILRWQLSSELSPQTTSFLCNLLLAIQAVWESALCSDNSPPTGDRRGGLLQNAIECIICDLIPPDAPSWLTHPFEMLKQRCDWRSSEDADFVSALTDIAERAIGVLAPSQEGSPSSQYAEAQLVLELIAARRGRGNNM